MKILFAKSNPITKEIENKFLIGNDKLNELSFDTPNLTIDWEKNKVEVKKISFYWLAEKKIDDYDYMGIKLQFLLRSNFSFFELFIEDGPALFKTSGSKFSRKDKSQVSFSNGELGIFVNENSNEKIKLKPFEKSVSEFDCPVSQCEIDGDKVVMEFDSEIGFHENSDNYDASFGFRKITFEPKNGLAKARANLNELKKKTTNNVKIKDINATECRLEGDNLIIESYSSDNLSVNLAGDGEENSGNLNTWAGGGKTLSEEDNANISQTDATNQQFLYDLDNNHENKNGVKSLFEKHNVDRPKFESKINKLSENEIKKFYHGEDLENTINLTQLENWITANLNQIKASTETTEGGSAPSTNLLALRTSAIDIIKASLNQTPPLTNTDLSSEYQNWERKINSADSPESIDTLKESLLAHIKSQRKNQQTAQNINENLQKAKNPNATIQDKKEALSNLEQNEGEQAYEEKKEETKKIKEEVARDNPIEYRDKFLSTLPNKLTQNELTEAELDTETKSEIENLKNETDSAKIVEKEMKITQKLGQQGAIKKITNFKKELEKVLKTNNKTQVKQLKEKLINFINSNNVYFRAQKNEAKKLLKQLEKNSQNQNTNNPSNFPWKIVIPGSLLVGSALALFLVIRAKKKKKKQKIALSKSTNQKSVLI